MGKERALSMLYFNGDGHERLLLKGELRGDDGGR